MAHSVVSLHRTSSTAVGGKADMSRTWLDRRDWPGAVVAGRYVLLTVWRSPDASTAAKSVVADSR